jgi:hypothetical protein
MKETQRSRRTFLWVGDVPYQKEGSVSAKVDKPTGVKQRLMRGFSDTFGSSLYDLPQTREEVIEVNEIVGKDGVVLLGTDATEPHSSLLLGGFQNHSYCCARFADTQFPERSGLVLGGPDFTMMGYGSS